MLMLFICFIDWGRACGRLSVAVVALCFFVLVGRRLSQGFSDLNGHYILIIHINDQELAKVFNIRKDALDQR